jgi:uncharacterized membrane protein
MTLLVLVALLALVGWRLAVPLFEFVFGSLVAAPLVWFLCAKLLLLFGFSIGAPGFPSNVLYAVSFGLIIGATYTVFGQRKEPRHYTELYPIAAFAMLFSAALYLCSLWPDFIAMGERLRDYAILASTVQSPVIPNEPWMDGATLNYYVYWYRFGAMLSSLLNLDVWQAYHVIVAFAIAFYGATLFQIVRVIIGGSALWALVSSVVISFGSNYAGFRLWKRSDSGVFEPDDGWWGPSRVIQGAINEFPAWSFLLGDAHPHYLNLGALPFFLLILYSLLASGLPVGIKSFHACALLGAATLFLLGSNAWEVPMWLGLASVVMFLYSVFHWDVVRSRGAEFFAAHAPFDIFRAVVCSVIVAVGCLAAVKGGESVSLVTRLFLIVVAFGFAAVCFPYRQGILARIKSYRTQNAPSVVSGAFWVLLILALYLSSRHIVPEGGSLTLVRSPILVTTTAELFAHWGFHLAIILASSLLVLRMSALLQLFLALVFVIIASVYDKAALLICVLIGIQLVRLLQMHKDIDGKEMWRHIFMDALLLGGLGLLLLPELVFLDDPYGGEHERMNTIFKVYATAWGIVALGGVGLLHQARRTLPEPSSRFWLAPGIFFSLALVMGGLNFLFHSVPMRVMRSSDAYGLEGLAAPNEAHPGAGATIRALRRLPRGRVLEAQGNAYSYTSFVSTLAAQPSYLGWSNHVNLLTREYGEVGRREKTTDQIYLETDCSRRKAMVRQENISYIVIGTLEKMKYSDIAARDFSCFTKIIEEEDYILYSPTPN